MKHPQGSHAPGGFLVTVMASAIGNKRLSA